VDLMNVAQDKRPMTGCFDHGDELHSNINGLGFI
jgi:hypothetical protein